MRDTEQALLRFAATVHAVLGDRLQAGRFVRDIFGRLSFLAPPGLSKDETAALENSVPDDLAPFVDLGEAIVVDHDAITDALLSERGQTYVLDESGAAFVLLDRRLAGDDWLQRPVGLRDNPPRLAFYGLKGGVGRSTALAITAADLASIGKNVLVIDLDLEAPGLGSILLREDQHPELGVLDWLTYGSAGGDPSTLVADMIGGSSFTTGAGVIDVVPAAGLSTVVNPTGFFPKLARAYTPGAASGRLRELSFSEKIEELLADLLQRRVYDVVLLDVRAGLHETSAASLLGLGTTVLLFGLSAIMYLT